MTGAADRICMYTGSATRAQEQRTGAARIVRIHCIHVPELEQETGAVYKNLIRSRRQKLNREAGYDQETGAVFRSRN